MIFLEEILFIHDYDNITSYFSIVQTTRITTATVYVDLALMSTLGYMLYKMSTGRVHSKRAESFLSDRDKDKDKNAEDVARLMGDTCSEEIVIDTSNKADISEQTKSPISARDPSRRAQSQRQFYPNNTNNQRNSYMRSEHSLSYKSPTGVEAPRSNQEFDYNNLTVRQDVRKLYG